MAMEQIVPASSLPAEPQRRSLGVLIFVPLLIALVGLAAIVVGLLPMTQAVESPSGYGVDDLVTGSIAPRAAVNPIILLDR